MPSQSTAGPPVGAVLQSGCSFLERQRPPGLPLTLAVGKLSPMGLKLLSQDVPGGFSALFCFIFLLSQIWFKTLKRTHWRVISQEIHSFSSCKNRETESYSYLGSLWEFFRRSGTRPVSDKHTSEHILVHLGVKGDKQLRFARVETWSATNTRQGKKKTYDVSG